MEERALIAIVISIMIIILYQYLFVPKTQKKEVSKIKQEEKEEIIVKKDEEKEVKIDKEINKIFESQKMRKKRDFVINTKRYTARITNDGGKIISFRLKDYYEKEKHETWPLKTAFWKYIGESYRKFFGLEKVTEDKKREQIELIHKNDRKYVKCLSIESISNKDIEDIYKEGVYDVQEDEYIDANNNIIKSLKMNFINDRGILIEKEIQFYDNEYKLDIDIKQKNLSEVKQKIDYALIWGPGIGKGKNKAEHHRFVGPAIWANGKKTRIKPKKIQGIIEKEGNIEWIAIENTYFTVAILPFEKSSIGVIYKEKEEDDEIVSIGIKNKKRFIEPGGQVSDRYQVYIGPKRKENLAGVSQNLEEVIDYGWFSFLARPMIWLLKKIYQYIPNYGFAIILLTIIIKIIFWPLTEKSFSSMRDMQKIQPKMNELREKYKSDPTKMNREIMSLYKKHGVSPLGGCLPMILQIPVFFALYEGLLVAIEMRGAPFMFWIKDLSAMDPLLITPILMGITMYIQQKMMPTGIDPKQAKMMNLMPVIFTVFFLGFPSGLVIYWLLNNVLTIGHQYLIYKRQRPINENVT